MRAAATPFACDLPASASASHERAPTFQGNRADFAGVLDGDTDIRVFAQAEGAHTFFVLKSVPASPHYTVLVDAPGLKLKLRNDGAVEMLDGDSNVVALLLRPYMVDSSDAGGGGRESEEIEVVLGTQEGHPSVTYSPDRSFLATATYPVFVDPSVTFVKDAHLASADAYVSSANPTNNYGDVVNPNTGRRELRVGGDPNDPAGDPSNNVRRTLINFDLSAIDGMAVPLRDALREQTGDPDAHPVSFSFMPLHQQADGARTWISPASGPWEGMAVTWNTKPGLSAEWLSSESYIGQREAITSETMASWVREWLWHPETNHGLNLYVPYDYESDGSLFKRIVSSEDPSLEGPKLRVTWFHPLDFYTVDDPDAQPDLTLFSDYSTDPVLVAEAEVGVEEGDGDSIDGDAQFDAAGQQGVAAQSSFRYPVEDTTVGGGRRVGRLFGSSRTCIAWPISRQATATLITAAHCLYASNVGGYIYPTTWRSRSNGSGTGGMTCDVISIRVPRAWEDSQGAPVELDFGSVKVQCPFDVGKAFGYRWKIADNGSNIWNWIGKDVRMIGYPAAPCAAYTPPTLWGGKGRVTSDKRSSYGTIGKLKTDIQTCGGDSGGPVYITRYNQQHNEFRYHVIGIHSKSPGHAALITHDVYMTIHLCWRRNLC